MTRRSLIQKLSLLAALSPLSARAYPILKILGPVRKEYLHEYVQRMLKWYDREFFPIRKSMSGLERDFFDEWLEHMTTWGLSLTPNQMFPYFVFSHRCDGNHMDSSRLALGLSSWPAPLRQKARTVLKKRGAVLPKDADAGFFGLGWDFEKDEIKSYYLHDLSRPPSDPEIQKWSLAHTEDIWMKPRMSAWTSHNGRLVKKKLIVPAAQLTPKSLPPNPAFDIVTVMKLIESGEKVRWHYRLRSFFMPLVSDVSHRALSEHSQEFQQFADSLIFEDKNHYTFYYP